ncbi:MAG: hypothetical protein QF632_02200 [Candidatus Woesearchaeota archaeon]|nr:hypothetical protein [Candidatus Woesearchaeota archaeon]MDP7323551.1 hypothetical protein [Candidatus Woesearchaeota archaeon]MDP7458117.1 hypothetical protein [Candidatus Woesearchaeota archaeon]
MKDYPKLTRTLSHINLSLINNSGVQQYIEEYMYGGLLCGM